MSSASFQVSGETSPESMYTLNWLFGDVFGHSVEFIDEPSENREAVFEISTQGSDATLQLPNIFLKQASNAWLKMRSIPDDQFFDASVSVNDRSIEFAIFADNHTPGLTQLGPNQHRLGIDIFGSIFFLISRYEEAVSVERDDHDRFLASASCLYKKPESFFRAIGNEYIELLWAAIQHIWPGIERKPRSFRLMPSHDIDWPSLFATQSILASGLTMAKRVIKQKSLKSARQLLQFPYQYLTGGQSVDPFNNIDWIAEQSEHHGLRSAFYYIPEWTHEFDSRMPINHITVQEQWKRINSGGHEIGIHPGYETYRSSPRIESAANAVRNQLDRLGIVQPEIGGRHHFLRWRSSETATHWDAAGMTYDSTLGFAEQPGFRCGVCYEFPMYDLENRKPLKLVQRPLVAMECSVIDAQYMDLGLTSDAFNLFQTLKQECQKYHGDFTLLWHNTWLLTPKQRDFYQSLLAA